MSWTLYTFAMSHYSEKIRWTLDASKVDYREVRMTPVFHILPALIMGKRGKTTLPVLKTPQGSIQDSGRILLWLEKNRAPFPLIPKALSQDIHAVEHRFDAIGKDVARALYAASFGKGDDHILKLWTDFATPIQSVFVRKGYGFIRWAFRRKLNITKRGAERAHQRITEVIDWLEGQLSDGRTYLVGQQFTAADITAASLLAPIACPQQHPVYGDPVYQKTMVDATAPWRDRRALQWVRAMYDLHRGQFQAEGQPRRAA